MSVIEKKSVICFLAREPGVRCLEGLLKSSAYVIKAVFTHRKIPASENPLRPEREEFSKISVLCRQYSIPLHVVDTREESRLLEALPLCGDFDYIISCSWRFLIAENVLHQAKRGTVNLHRGKLPEYKGAEPVRRALEDQQEKIYLTAHEMDGDYDTGRVLATYALNAKIGDGEGIDEATDRLKRELYPYYPQLMLEAMSRK